MARNAFLSLSLLLALGACSSTSQDLSDLENEDRADSIEENVSFEETDEPLFSASLRAQVCSSIGVSDCDPFDMTVTRIGRSNVLKHASNGRAVTVLLGLEVENTSSGEIIHADLKRTINEDFGLSFAVEVHGSSLDTARNRIGELADEGGEFPDFDQWLEDGVVRTIEFADLPSDIRDIFEDAKSDRIEDLNSNLEEESDADYSDFLPFLEILDDGEVIGYILSIDDFIDHPFFDGGGVHIYYDITGVEIHAEEWAG